MASYDGAKPLELCKYPKAIDLIKYCKDMRTKTKGLHPTARALVDRCKDFFAEVQDLTPGHELEAHLNAKYGPGHPIYDDLVNYIRQGLVEGWCAADEVAGPNYRRTKICLPSPETRFFSITTVYMNNQTGFKGQYHKHPYGEINLVCCLDETAQLKGMSGWQGPGWTSPGPGTHHYPEVRGGALVSLFFLPAGRIAYDAQPGAPQPVSI